MTYDAREIVTYEAVGNEPYIVQGKEICVVNEISIFVSCTMIYAMVKESVE